MARHAKARPRAFRPASLPVMPFVILLATRLVIQAAPAGAMSEEELQRCVWGCLANFGPNTNPAYHTCVKDKCVADGSEPVGASGTSVPAAPTVAKRWSSGSTHDGSAYYAGFVEDESYGFYYLCDRQGRSELTLTGLQGPAAAFSIVVDGVDFQQQFNKDSARHAAPLSPGDPLFAALSRGAFVEVRNPSGATVMRYGLSGSSKALDVAVKSCR